MFRDILLVTLSVGTIVAMTLILRWFFRKLTRIEEEQWAEMAGDSTPRWARFLLGKKKRTETGSTADSGANETEQG